jgi:hypothetical protein
MSTKEILASVNQDSAQRQCAVIGLGDGIKEFDIREKVELNKR